MPEDILQSMNRVFKFYKKISQIRPVEGIEKKEAYDLLEEKGLYNLEFSEQKPALNEIAKEIVKLNSKKLEKEPITREEVINIIESVIKKHSSEGKLEEAIAQERRVNQQKLEEERRINQQKLMEMERKIAATNKPETATLSLKRQRPKDSSSPQGDATKKPRRQNRIK